MRRTQHGDAQPAGLRRGGIAGVEQAVLVGQAVVAHHRDDARERHARHAPQVARAGLQQAGVAAEPVQHEAVQRAAQVVGQQRPGAEQVGERAAAVDVGDQQAVQRAEFACLARAAQVDVVLRREIDLGGRAGAFDDDEVAAAGQSLQACARCHGQRGAAFAPA